MNAPSEDAVISRDSLPLASRGFRRGKALFQPRQKDFAYNHRSALHLKSAASYRKAGCDFTLLSKSKKRVVGANRCEFK